MAPEVTVRHAGRDDAESMVRFLAELLAEELDTISARTVPTVQEEQGWLERAGSLERALILIAVQGEEVIGLLDLWGDERAAYVHTGKLGMSVARSWRGRGVGRRLLQAAIREARSWTGFCRIELECVPWNAPAIRLYERLGFVLEARKSKAVNFRGRPEDMLVMALTW